MEALFDINTLSNSTDFLNTVLENMHSSVFILTKDREIKAVNTSGQALLEKDEEAIINNIFGNVLDCMNTEEGKFQCGYTDYCKDCPLLNTINNIFDNKEQVRKNIFDRKNILRDGEITDKYFMYSARIIEYDGIDMVLLIIDDITELEKQKQALNEKNEQIYSSIRYAKRIQEALLPGNYELSNILKEYFLFYQPRDIIGGDFYWAAQVEGKTILAAGDCTGHGIPGALLTILGITSLNEIVKAGKTTNPAKILNRLRNQIISELSNYEYQDFQDGIDISVCSLDTKNDILHFAGANNSILYIHNDNLEEIKGDRMPVGRYRKMDDFSLQEINYKKGDLIYLFSDGYPDQFGGENNKKLGKKRFKNLIQRISSREMSIQKESIRDTFHNWKDKTEQVDDIIVLGLKLI